MESIEMNQQEVVTAPQSKQTKTLDAHPACPWMSEETDIISEAIAKAQGELKQPKFNRSVNYGATKFNYADLNECLSVALPVLSKHGISLTQLEWNGELITILQKANQWIKAVTKLPQVAKMQDKGSALTYTKRYALTAMLGMSAEDDDDANIIDQTNKLPDFHVTPKQKPKAIEYVEPSVAQAIRACKSREDLQLLYSQHVDWKNDTVIKKAMAEYANELGKGGAK